MNETVMMRVWRNAMLAIAIGGVVLPMLATAQDQQDQQGDPPSRVARLGYMEGSVSFQPSGETEWVQAVSNRPMTTGDKIWADRDSRAELQLGSAVIRLSANTGVSFLNLDDRTVQVQLSSGAVNIRVRRLNRDDVFEIDTPNLAFTVLQPGSYRLEASEDGGNTAVSIRTGDGEATGNGQTYTLHAGQRGQFSGTNSLNADVEQIGGPDQFDNWANERDRRYDNSRSAQYVSHDVVGYDDLDDNGDWRDDPNYGHVWFPHVDAGWAPYREGHWDWIDPWGYTWVDDSSWGYAPFHYGRWVTFGGRWGWIAGPPAVEPVYAPALVVFIGGGGSLGGNVGWFPLGPREVYVPSYPVSREYVNRVNVSNTTVNTTTITNVYNATIINKTTNVTNLTYVNRNVQGAVTAVPQHTFASAQPVARAAVVVNAQQISAAQVSARVAVAPTQQAVLGAKAGTANHVSTPPQAVMNRQVIAKATPPPPAVPFAKQQAAMAAHPGQPLPKNEMASLRPSTAAAAPHPMVKQAPPGKPATPNMGRPGNPPPNGPNAARPGQPMPGVPPNQPANRPGNPPPNEPNAARPGQATPGAPADQPANRPGNPPVPRERPGAANPAQPNYSPATPPTNRPEPTQPNARPQTNRPPESQPNSQPETKAPSNRPDTNRPTAIPTNSRPEPARSEPNRSTEPPVRDRNARPLEPQADHSPEPDRPETKRTEPNRNEPAARPQTPPPGDRPQQHTPPPADVKPGQKPKPQTPEEKRREEEQKRQEERKQQNEQDKPPGG